MANFFKKTINILDFRAVIQAQLVERLLLTSVIRGSNSVIIKFNLLLMYSKSCAEKTRIKKKRPGKAKKKKNNLPKIDSVTKYFGQIKATIFISSHFIAVRIVTSSQDRQISSFWSYFARTIICSNQSWQRTTYLK